MDNNNSVLRSADGVLLRLERATIAVGCVLIWAIVGLILAQMFGRVLFKIGLPWADELARYLHIVMVFIGIGYAVGGNILMGVVAALLAVFTAYVRATAKSVGAPNDFCGPATG